MVTSDSGLMVTSFPESPEWVVTMAGMLATIGLDLGNLSGVG
jgi:hypothetical protein